MKVLTLPFIKSLWFIIESKANIQIKYLLENKF